MTVGIVGLGLISGSMAKAYAEACHRVLADNRNRTILDFAILDGAVSAPLTAENMAEYKCRVCNCWLKKAEMASQTNKADNGKTNH